MIHTTVQLLCEVCRNTYNREPWNGDNVRLLMLTAEADGWKVNRLAQDAYYGNAWCRFCRDDKCTRCGGRGYYPDFSNWDSYHGEPARKECDVCDGVGHVRNQS